MTTYFYCITYSFPFNIFLGMQDQRTRWILKTICEKLKSRMKSQVKLRFINNLINLLPI